jgi:hypothetical protein
VGGVFLSVWIPQREARQPAPRTPGRPSNDPIPLHIRYFPSFLRPLTGSERVSVGRRTEERCGDRLRSDLRKVSQDFVTTALRGAYAGGDGQERPISLREDR